jgi:hypothetical protein
VWAGRFTWARFAAELAAVYLTLAGVPMAGCLRGSGQPVVEVAASTEGGEVRRGQGAAAENIGSM